MEIVEIDHRGKIDLLNPVVGFEIYDTVRLVRKSQNLGYSVSFPYFPRVFVSHTVCFTSIPVSVGYTPHFAKTLLHVSIKSQIPFNSLEPW